MIDKQGVGRRGLLSVLGKDASERSNLILTLTTAIIAVSALVFSSPEDMRISADKFVHRYNVKMKQLADRNVTESQLTITGTARLDPSWSLVILTQDPSHFRYYLSNQGAAVSVQENGGWTATVTLGTKQDAQNSASEPFRIYALLLDDRGQEQLSAGLDKSQSLHEEALVESLPHYAAKAVMNVNLVK